MRREMDDQRHDFLAVQLAIRLDGGDRHPVEREQHRHQEEAEWQIQPECPRPETLAADHYSMSGGASAECATEGAVAPSGSPARHPPPLVTIIPAGGRARGRRSEAREPGAWPGPRRRP